MLDFLASELLANIFISCNSISDVLSLASTCCRLQHVYKSSRRLQILCAAAEAEYGPLEDAAQVVTHNSSQPAHILRNVPLSFAFLKQLMSVGKVAKAWEGIYPFKKWKENFEDRRLLTNNECYVFRRALYRLWLYSKAFHNAGHSRHSRLQRPIILERAMLLHSWTTDELSEIADVRSTIREVLNGSVCPSNGTIQRKFRKRFPDTNYQLLFNMHLNYPPPNATNTQNKFYAKYKPTPFHEPGSEGWGDDVSHYYVLEDMLKLNPAQILWLKDNAFSKCQVETYVRNLGEWFDNNGETFGQTLEFVLDQRSEDVGEFWEAVATCELGVARDSD